MTYVLGDWLAERLQALGIRRVYGAAVRGLPHVLVRDGDIARLLAATDGRVLGGLGASFDSDQVLYLGSAPGAVVVEKLITSAQQLAAELHDPAGFEVPGGVALRLALLLDEPPPQDLPPPVRPLATPPILAPGRVVALAGPGAVRAGHSPEIQAFSERMGIGVLATWGAMGVLPHDHPNFLGVVGLQSRDLVLGLAGAEQVLGFGIDPAELHGERPTVASLIVRPETLAGITARSGAFSVEPSALARDLADAVRELQSSGAAPVHACRAYADLHHIVPSNAIIAADAGLVGFWAVRTFATLRSAGVVVPAGSVAGFAAAAALVAALDGRPAVGITTYPVDPATALVVEAARSLGSTAVVLAWGLGAPEVDANDFEGVVRRALVRPTPVVSPLGVSTGATATVTDVAGPIAAWPTLTGRMGA